MLELLENIDKNFIEKCFKSFDEIELLKNTNKFVVAVSGGIDSLSLTIIAGLWAKKNNKKIIALTVDHKLRPTSTDEATYVNNLLEKYSIEHHTLTWNDVKPTSNIENIAREARYNLIFDFCRENNISSILLGHHIQDQAENFLIRLFRGSGISGLSSMQKISTRNGFYLIRPFLNLKKEELKEFLLKANINWIEDESHSDEKYLRNKIRAFLNSFEEKDNIVKRINSTIDILQTADEIIENQVNSLENSVYIYNQEYNYYTLKLYEFLKLNKEVQYRILTKITKNITKNTQNSRFSKIERLRRY